MPGTRIERGISEQRPPQKREQAIIIGDEVEIVSPNHRAKAVVRVTSKGAEIIAFEKLTSPEERRIKARGRFISSIRELLTAILARNATMTAWETDTIDQATGEELNLAEVQNRFSARLSRMQSLHFGEPEVRELVRNQVRQLTIGETKMGFVPDVVREASAQLHEKIAEVYNPTSK